MGKLIVLEEDKYSEQSEVMKCKQSSKALMVNANTIKHKEITVTCICLYALTFSELFNDSDSYRRTTGSHTEPL